MGNASEPLAQAEWDPSRASPGPSHTSACSWEIILERFAQPATNATKRKFPEADGISCSGPPPITAAGPRVARLGWVLPANVAPKHGHRKIEQFVSLHEGCDELDTSLSTYTISGRFREPVHTASSSGACNFRLNLLQCARDFDLGTRSSHMDVNPKRMRGASAKRFYTHVAEQPCLDDMLFLQCTRVSGDTFVFHSFLQGLGAMMESELQPL